MRVPRCLPLSIYVNTLVTQQKIDIGTCFRDGFSWDDDTPERFDIVRFPLDPSTRIQFDLNEAGLASEQSSVPSESQPLSARCSSEHRQLLIRIERSRFDDIAKTMLGHALPRPLKCELALEVTQPAQATLCRLAALLCEDMERGGPLSEGSVVARFSECLLAALLSCWRSTDFSVPDTPARSIAPTHVKRAERFMREHAAEPISLAEIAHAAGVSVRALQYGFKRFRDKTPRQSLQSIRMEAARAELLVRPKSETVTTIALRWGFTHPSRFAGIYRRLYGEVPSETLRRELPPRRIG